MKTLPANALDATAEFKRGYFHVVVPPETRTEDILKPGFWANHVRTLKPGYLVDIVTADYELDMQVRVIRIEPGLVVVRPRIGFESEARRAEQDAPATAEETRRPLPPEQQVPEGYKVGFNKGLGNYVMMKSTGANVATKLPSKAAAVQFAIRHHAIANTPGGAPAKQAEGAGAGA